MELSNISDVMISGKNEIFFAKVALNVNAYRVKCEDRRFVDMGRCCIRFGHVAIGEIPVQN
jgi:hypothetical protein